MHERFDRITPGIAAKLNLLLDLLLVPLGLALASWHLEVVKAPAFALWSLLVMVGWFVCVAVLRLYSPWTPRRQLDGHILRGLATLAATVTSAIVLAIPLHPQHDFDASTFALVLFVGTTLTQVVFSKRLMRSGDVAQSILIVGTSSLGLATYEALLADGTPRRVIGFLRFANQPDSVPFNGVPVLGTVDQLLSVVCDLAVEEVYFAAQVLEHGQLLQELVRSCEEVGLPFALPVHSLHFERASLLSSSPVRDGYLHYLSTKAAPLDYALKRLFDIFASSAALVVLSPLLLFVALAIKLTSPGRVFFRQVRVGLHGAKFDLLKFRSMVTNAEALRAELEAQNEQSGPVFKMKNDPRITAIGRFIRKYSIDELPQLINILRGDMTIVGPRPALPAEVSQYTAWQRRRLSVRPGLTCYWQVSGRNNIGFDQWMKLDLRYVDNWSIHVDMQLIASTVPVVLAGRGAS